MTFDHIFFIPLVAFGGMLVGFVLGARAARNTIDLERKRDAERAKVRAERAARKASAPTEGAADKPAS